MREVPKFMMDDGSMGVEVDTDEHSFVVSYYDDNGDIEGVYTYEGGEITEVQEIFERVGRHLKSLP
jgi:hypothetical protein